jgi:putative phage-type endonuclease
MTIHNPKSTEEWLQLRQAFVSSTESSALFGLNPYMTPYELAVIKKSAEPSEVYKDNERQRWGKMLQRVIAQSIADDYGVKVRALTAYATDDHIKIGASFDYEVVGLKDGWEQQEEGQDNLRRLYNQHGTGVLEIKNVDGLVYKNDWLEEGPKIEAPPHIELQVQHQLAVIGRLWSAIGVLIGGNRRLVIARMLDEDVANAIRAKVERFWKGLAQGKMPPLTMPQDARVIRDLYGYADTNSILDYQGEKAADGDGIHEMALKHKESTHWLSEAKKAHETTGALLMMSLGTASKALFDDMTINATMVKSTIVPEHERAGYRSLRIYPKKVKGAKNDEPTQERLV